MDQPLPDRLEQNARVEVKVAGVSKGIRRTLNFASGLLTAVDSATGEEVTLTIDGAAIATALAGNGLDASGSTLVVDPSEFSAGMAGAGLTEASGAFAVGAGHGLDVTADAVDVDETELTGSLIPGIGSAKIGEVVVGATPSIITFSSIPATYRHLRLVMNGRGNAAVVQTNTLMRFNSDAAGNYDAESMFANGTSVSGATMTGTTFLNAGNAPGSSVTAANPATKAGMMIYEFPDYRGTTFHKNIRCSTGFNQPTGTRLVYQIVGTWRSTAAINRIDIHFNAIGTGWMTGTVASLYGST